MRLAADFSVQRVWTVAAGQLARAEWLVIRREGADKFSYTLLNDPHDADPLVLIRASCQRCDREVYSCL